MVECCCLDRLIVLECWLQCLWPTVYLIETLKAKSVDTQAIFSGICLIVKISPHPLGEAARKVIDLVAGIHADYSWGGKSFEPRVRSSQLLNCGIDCWPEPRLPSFDSGNIDAAL
jgi:hypothetical protein